jgi:hypothetical protein
VATRHSAPADWANPNSSTARSCTSCRYSSRQPGFPRCRRPPQPRPTADPQRLGQRSRSLLICRASAFADKGHRLIPGQHLQAQRFRPLPPSRPAGSHQHLPGTALREHRRYVLRAGHVVEHQQPAAMVGQPAMQRRHHHREVGLGLLGQVKGAGQSGEVAGQGGWLLGPDPPHHIEGAPLAVGVLHRQAGLAHPTQPGDRLSDRRRCPPPTPAASSSNKSWRPVNASTFRVLVVRCRAGGRPEAARRTGLEFVEKLLTTNLTSADMTERDRRSGPDQHGKLSRAGDCRSALVTTDARLPTRLAEPRAEHGRPAPTRQLAGTPRRAGP